MEPVSIIRTPFSQGASTLRYSVGERPVVQLGPGRDPTTYARRVRDNLYDNKRTPLHSRSTLSSITNLSFAPTEQTQGVRFVSLMYQPTWSFRRTFPLMHSTKLRPVAADRRSFSLDYPCPLPTPVRSLVRSDGPRIGPTHTIPSRLTPSRIHGLPKIDERKFFVCFVVKKENS